MADREKRDRMLGMLLTDRKFADAVFEDPEKVLTDLGFGADEIETIKGIKRESFSHLSDKLDARMTQNQRTSSKECFPDEPPSKK
ncbi:MAG: hypothetical protein B6244_14745 [Candidatus Cloacimonetes bacterium 4572_55]|nr:MAG: hypothetical protein B6244_14745 [Candidatus Cloacimonetes bacterium 4572_55]